jgi:hypothetical protein
MQSSNIQGTTTITEIISEVVKKCRESVVLNYVGGGVFEGAISGFLFAANPANSLEKILEISGVKFVNCVLKSATQIKIGRPLLTVGQREPNFVIGTSYLVSELAPYFFDCNIKEQNTADNAQPALWIPRPQKEIFFASNAESLGIEIDLTLVLSDHSKDIDWRVGSGQNNGFSESDFTTYIEKPLRVYFRKIIKTLENFTYNNATVVFRGDYEKIESTFIRRFGQDSTLTDLAFDQNLSGLVFVVPLKIFNTDCLV